MGNQTATPGRIVVFSPSERTKKEFKKKQNDTYPAIITEVNESSVDLTVFGVGEIVFVNRVLHKSLAVTKRSSWDWPERI